MATEVRTFDLYNTTNYWVGYQIPNYQTEQLVTRDFYATQFNSNPIGASIDFFTNIANTPLNYLWKKYWWDEARYYSHPIVAAAIESTVGTLYQAFSESVGTLYNLSRSNNLNNTQTIPYSPVISNLIRTDISEAINSFYQVANNLYANNVAGIGPAGTDTDPENSNLIMADTDLERRITSNLGLTASINNLYPSIAEFLPFNTSEIGNLFTPYLWNLSANNEDVAITVDFNNNNLSVLKQLTTDTLIAK